MRDRLASRAGHIDMHPSVTLTRDGCHFASSSGALLPIVKSALIEFIFETTSRERGNNSRSRIRFNCAFGLVIDPQFDHLDRCAEFDQAEALTDSPFDAAKQSMHPDQ